MVNANLWFAKTLAMTVRSETSTLTLYAQENEASVADLESLPG